MIYSERNQPRPGSGSTTAAITKLDSIWVAAFDKNMNLKRIYKSDKLGYSSGRFRSQYISQLGKADNGDVYVFSGHFERTLLNQQGHSLSRKTLPILIKITSLISTTFQEDILSAVYSILQKLNS